MAIPFRQHLDLGGNNEIRNALIQRLSGAPASPTAGQFYFDMTKNAAFVYSGTAWRPFDAAQLADGSIVNAALATNPLARANHTGTQLAATISDLATVVKNYSLDQFAQPTAGVNFNSQTLTGLGTSTSASAATRYDQVQQMIAAAVSGQTAIKNPARVIATSNITLSATQTIDGVSLVAGDRVLVTNQTTSTQNGLYVVAAGAWTLATDANFNGAWIEGTEILVAEGSTYAGTIWRVTNQGAFTVGTTALVFVQTAKVNTYTADETSIHLTGTQFSVKLGAGITTDGSGIAINTALVARKYNATITGDGSTTTFTVVHNLNSSDALVQLKDSSSNIDFADINTSNVNQAVVTFGTAPGAGVTYRVNVIA